MANRSSNSRLLAIGFAVLVVGVVLVLVIIRNTEDPPVEASPVAAEQQSVVAQAEPTESATPLTEEQLSTARMPLPLDVPEGTEAMAVRVNFMRSVAAVPTAGDVVNLYRLPEPSEDEDEQVGADDADEVLAGVEVLAMTGPLPAANDGTLTVVLAVPTADVRALMPLANRSELWLTLPPAPEDADAEQGTPTEDTTEEPS